MTQDGQSISYTLHASYTGTERGGLTRRELPPPVVRAPRLEPPPRDTVGTVPHTLPGGQHRTRPCTGCPASTGWLLPRTWNHTSAGESLSGSGHGKVPPALAGPAAAPAPVSPLPDFPSPVKLISASRADLFSLFSLLVLECFCFHVWLFDLLLYVLNGILLLHGHSAHDSPAVGPLV